MMGYYTEGSIRCFSPDNTETELYIACDDYCSFDLEDILDRSRSHFQNSNLQFQDLAISAQHIHTRCLGYDQYDRGDHTNFLLITLK
jgi:hypothetical protein